MQSEDLEHGQGWLGFLHDLVRRGGPDECLGTVVVMPEVVHDRVDQFWHAGPQSVAAAPDPVGHDVQLGGELLVLRAFGRQQNNPRTPHQPRWRAAAVRER